MEKDIIIDGQPLHLEVTGEGSALVLMHGWGCNLTTVRSIAAAASATHKVYNLDMPGFGKSPEPSQVWGVADYARMVERFVQLEGIVNPVLVGHSFGGRVAIMLASAFNISPDALVLVDAAGIKPKRSLVYYWKVYTFKAMKRLAPLLLGQERARKKIDGMRSRRGSSDYAQSSPKMRAVMSRVVNEDLKHLLKGIKAPALLIWGENDTATPMRDARMMEKLIPEGALVSFPGCGHYSFLDNPVQFAAVLQSCLGSRLKK